MRKFKGTRVGNYAVVEEYGRYKDTDYCVLLFKDGHRCACVDATKIFNDLYDENDDRIQHIDVHGGFTYCGDRFDDGRTWLGWDYMHYGDDIVTPEIMRNRFPENYYSYSKYYEKELLAIRPVNGRVYRKYYDLVRIVMECWYAISALKQAELYTKIKEALYESKLDYSDCDYAMTIIERVLREDN